MPNHEVPMGKHQGRSRGRGSGGTMWVRAFIVVSVGRNGQGRVNKFGTG